MVLENCNNFEPYYYNRFFMTFFIGVLFSLLVDFFKEGGGWRYEIESSYLLNITYFLFRSQHMAFRGSNTRWKRWEPVTLVGCNLGPCLQGPTKTIFPTSTGNQYA